MTESKDNNLDFILLYNEELDAVISLEFLADNLSKVVESDYFWKWNIIALHSALQGFMVLALQRGNLLSVLDKESRKHWYEIYKNGIEPKKPQKLDYFLNFYKDIKTDKMVQNAHSKKFTPNKTQDKYVEYLQSSRNEFIHLIPAEYGLDKRKFCKIILDTIPIIEFLVFQSNNVYLREGISKDRIAKLCNLIKHKAKKLHESYNSSIESKINIELLPKDQSI